MLASTAAASTMALQNNGTSSGGATMDRRQALRLTALAVPAILSGFRRAQAQDYPRHTITLVVPFPPGGGNDAMARIMADRLTESLGKTVVVENRAAGAGIVGTRSVVKAPPDG